MRLATIRTSSGTACVRMETATSATPIAGFTDVGALLGDADWEAIASAASGTPIPLTPEDFAPVVPRPGKIICVGLNYAKHIHEMGHEQPAVPTMFIKYPEALIGPYDTAEVPEFANQMADYEGELAVVVAKPARNVSDGAPYIAGYAVMNDFTMRDFQNQTSQWHQGKSFENTAGFGPWLDTDFQPGGQLRTQVNGELRQDDSTKDLVFSPAELVEYISKIYTLQPGDVIATGTPEGVGAGQKPPRFLQDGDVVEIEIAGIGTICNRVQFV
ncbi:fumarylacetoacetate hydrolase family protein [Corynebacterium sp. H128]|uniref:fumarylacetoacetate hydrolase family protein n=1 Tax=Corynebacterium sp. H128 TaxID=3133427 RepID=UPI0030A3285B